jgi:phytoene synthase
MQIGMRERSWQLEEWRGIESRTRSVALRASSSAGAWAAIVTTSRRVLRAYSSSFFLVTRFLPPAKRAEVEVIYASVRYPDEIADSFALPAARKLEMLAEWRSWYEEALGRRGVRESLLAGVPCFLAAFAEVVRRRSIPHQHYLDFLEAMRHDVRPGVFESLSDLIDRYVYGSAVVVGYFLAHVYGASDHTDFSETLASARELGIALQLTNFARDVAADHRRGRLYIPLDVMAEVGLDPENYFLPANRAKLRRCVQWMVSEAERRYAMAERTLDTFAPNCRVAIRACIDVYRQLNRRLGAGDADLETRQTVPTLEKFRVLPASKYWRLPLAYFGV